jgi:hypothetical protein
MLNAITPHEIGKLVAALDAGGIDFTDVAEIGQQAIAGHNRIKLDQARFTEDSASAVTAALVRWADGEGSLGEVVNVTTLNAASAAGRVELERLCRAGREAVETRATRAIRALGPDLFTAMKDRDAELVDIIAAQVAALDGIEGAEEAMTSSLETRTAWGVAHEAVTARAGLTKATGLLRSCRAIPGGEHRATDDIDGRYLALEHPFRWPEGERKPKHLVLSTLAEIKAGCGPWLASIDEARGAQAADIEAGDVVRFDPTAISVPR